MNRTKVTICFITILACVLFIGCQNNQVRNCALLAYDEYPDQSNELLLSKIKEELNNKGDLRIIDTVKTMEVLENALEKYEDEMGESQILTEVGSELNADIMCVITISEKNYSLRFVGVNTQHEMTFVGNIKRNGWTGKIKKMSDLGEIKKIDLTKIVKY